MEVFLSGRVWVEELHNKSGYWESLLVFYVHTHFFQCITTYFGLNFQEACLNFPHHFANTHVEHLILRTGKVRFSYDLTCFYKNSSHATHSSLHLSTWVVLNHPLKCSLDKTFHGLHIWPKCPSPLTTLHMLIAMCHHSHQNQCNQHHHHHNHYL